MSLIKLYILKKFVIYTITKFLYDRIFLKNLVKLNSKLEITYTGPIHRLALASY